MSFSPTLLTAYPIGGNNDSTWYSKIKITRLTFNLIRLYEKLPQLEGGVRAVAQTKVFYKVMLTSVGIYH